MKRVLEEELMSSDAQARAYAAADFEDAHSGFIRTFREFFHDREIRGYVLDLGCGPGDIAIRFARAYHECIVHGVDGSEAMLRCGREIISGAADVRGRITLYRGRLPGISPPRREYDVVLSNSLLHHLKDPMVLWSALRGHGAPGAPVFVMDLKRPAGRAEAGRLVEAYALGEPEVLRHDFYSSLLAAFEIEEIRRQLVEAGLADFLSVRAVSDRHVAVWGFLPPLPQGRRVQGASVGGRRSAGAAAPE